MVRITPNKTSLEQVPTSFGRIHGVHTKKPWALIVIFSILVIFGIFWMYEKHDTVKEQVVFFPPSQPTPTQKEVSFEELLSMQTALANTAVPDFSSMF